MKWKVSLFEYILLLLVIGLSWGYDTCTCSADFDIELASSPEPEYYWGPVMGEMENIYIKDITVSNIGTCDMYNLTPKIVLIHPRGKNSSFSLSPIQELKVGDTDYFNKRKLGNLEVVSGPITLYELGLYSIDYDLEIGRCDHVNLTPENTQILFSTITLNGQPLFVEQNAYFFVKSITELTLLKNAEETLAQTKRSADAAEDSATWAFIAAIIAFIVGLGAIVLNYFSSKNQIKRLGEVADNIESAAKLQREVIHDQEFRAKLNSLEACINELNHDLSVAEMIRPLCDSEKLEKQVNFQKFSHFCIDNFLSTNTLVGIPTNLPEKLFEIRHLLAMLNNQLDKTFYLPPGPDKIKLWKSISNNLNENNMKLMKEIKNMLEKLLKENRTRIPEIRAH